jgi:hypothetical protein
LAIARAYLGDSEGTGEWLTPFADQLQRQYFTRETLLRQLAERREVLAAIESFLLAHWPEAVTTTNAGPAEQLAMRTLAYHLASAAQRAQLAALFGLLATNIAAKVTDPQRRQVFGRTLYGLGEVTSLQTWVSQNLAAIEDSATEDDMFGVLWPCIADRIDLDNFRKWQPAGTLKDFAQAWLRGDSFGAIHAAMVNSNARIGLGAKPRRPTTEHIVEIGEGGFGFDGAHVIAGIIEVYGLLRADADTDTVKTLQALHKRFKYGLPSQTAVVLYEMGFADRVIAIAIANAIGPADSKATARRALRARRDTMSPLLEHYPAYFGEVFARVVR